MESVSDLNLKFVLGLLKVQLLLLRTLIIPHLDLTPEF
jgi:hypothetical protein